ncbi:lactonase family protein [Paracidobacterium acidisoli]|nr:beta-propeller fold lactonase family protein [Paracidobacterium acidisoli]MBT9332839.1 lactonase family protein [Paracidobacterium acidisoli]
MVVRSIQAVRSVRFWFSLPLAGLLMLCGCGQFFPPLTSGSGSGSGSGGATGDYLYVANSNSSLNTVAGFSIASGKLAGTNSSPYAIAVTPTTIAITPNNKYLYVADAIAGAIYGYTINSDGSLSVINNGNNGLVATQVYPLAMRVDTSGNWLVIADVSSDTAVFSVNSSSGALTFVSGTQVALTPGSAGRIAFNPADNLAFVAMGTGGVNVLNFNSSTGAISANQKLASGQAGGTSLSDTSLAVSPGGNFLFVTETTTGVKVLSIASNGALTSIAGSPYSTGSSGPNDVLVDSTGSYVYVANRPDATISAFSLNSTTGALTPIAGSPFSTGSEPSSLAEDNTHTYIAVACAGGSSDFEVYAIDTTTPGALDAFGNSTTGTDPTGAFQVVATN